MEHFEESLESQPDPESSESRRDPEDREVLNRDEFKDKMLDKTLADSFPTSDPPSTIPDPGGHDSSPSGLADDVLAGMPPGSWAAVSIDSGHVVGKGASREEAETIAKRGGHGKLSLVQVPAKPDGTAAA
jgi:hypothetical protein